MKPSILLLAALLLAGCDSQADEAAKDAAPAAAKGDVKAAAAAVASDDPRRPVIDRWVAGLSSESRAKLDALLPEYRQRYAADVAERSAAGRETPEKLAVFLASNHKAIEQLGPRIQTMFDVVTRMEAQQGTNTVNSAADVDRQRGQLATMLAEIVARVDAIGPVLKRDPLVAQAYTEWSRQNPIVGTIASRMTLLIDEPCRRDWSAQAESDSMFNSRGAALGMTEGQAIKGLCAANNNAVTLLTESPTLSHYLSQDEITAAGGAMPDALRTKYLGKMEFCFDCPGEMVGESLRRRYGSDRLLTTFMPNGQIVRIDRAQKFQTLSPAGSATAAPRKLGLLLPAMEERLGKPSFIIETTSEVAMAWVYPDRKAPLPLEHWYLTSERQGRAEMQLGRKGLIYDRGAISRTLLARQKPQATYCVNESGGIPVPNIGVAFGDLFTSAQRPLVANTRCGVVVRAYFSKVEGNRVMRVEGSPAVAPPVDTNANIYSLAISLIDTDAQGAWKQRELGEVRTALAAKKAKFEQDAANPSGAAFTP